jgi:hypothetical protein
VATISVVATAQPSNVPPRVKVDITDSGTPAITSVTVIRTDASGNVTPVRTLDGNPLTLTTSGSNRVGTLYDYEMPLGQAVTYSTNEYPAGVSSAVTVNSTSVWLVHPGNPAKSVTLDLRINSFDTQERTATVGVFYPMGRANPVVITDGRRHGRTSTIIAGTDTFAQLTALHSLIDDAGVLFLNPPPALALGVDPSYIAVLDVQEKRRTDIGSDPYRDLTMPYVVVDRPAGGSQALWTWANVMATYSSWTAVMAANVSWTALQFPS